MRTNTAAARRVVRTHEGAPARHITPEQELRRTLMACLLWEDTFYEGGEAVADRIVRLVGQVPPEIAAGLAIEAREAMKLRHAPLWLIRALAARKGAGPHVQMALRHIVQRPDELAEFLALYWSEGRTPIAAGVKRGLAAAFRRFDAYQLAKYDRPDGVRLRDVLFLTA